MKLNRITAVSAGAVIIALGTMGGSVAGGLVTSAQIKDGAVHQVDLSDGVVTLLHQAGPAGPRGATGATGATGAIGAIGAIGAKGATGATGARGATGATGAKGATGDTGAAGAQGPKGDPGAPGAPGKDGKDGVSNLIAGAGYTNTWNGDDGTTLQTAREECPAGQYALGGGFSTWGGDKDLGGDNKNIQITVSAPYFEGEYKPVDAAGNFRPTEWVVKGYNNGNTDQIVRAWVTCASVN